MCHIIKIYMSSSNPMKYVSIHFSNVSGITSKDNPKTLKTTVQQLLKFGTLIGVELLFLDDKVSLETQETAFVDYYEIDDALQTRSTNVKQMSGSYLHDFLRPQAPDISTPNIVHALKSNCYSRASNQTPYTVSPIFMQPLKQRHVQVYHSHNMIH
ncbi:hypothetical protein YC2023_037004 [Brassica napus]